jgi:hypothetical protein
MKSKLLIFLGLVLIYSCGSGLNNSTNWTHTELTEYLLSKDLKFETISSFEGGFYGAPMEYKFENGETVLFILTENEQKAKDLASADGDKAFAFARFYVLEKSDNGVVFKKLKEILK